MKKTAAFFLLFVYILIQAASVCWHFYKPIAHAYFLQQSKDEDNGLSSLTIDHNKLGELKNEDGEVVIDGILYDVEMSVSSGSMVKLLLKKDSKETDWNTHYKKITNILHTHTDDRHATQGKISFSLIPLFYCKAITTDLCFVNYLDRISAHPSSCFYPWPAKEMTTPPPRSC